MYDRCRRGHGRWWSKGAFSALGTKEKPALGLSFGDKEDISILMKAVGIVSASYLLVCALNEQSYLYPEIILK